MTSGKNVFCQRKRIKCGVRLLLLRGTSFCTDRHTVNQKGLESKKVELDSVDQTFNNTFDRLEVLYKIGQRYLVEVVINA